MDLNSYAVTVLTEYYDNFESDESVEDFKNDISTPSEVAEWFERLLYGYGIIEDDDANKTLLQAILNTICWLDVYNEVWEYIKTEES